MGLRSESLEWVSFSFAIGSLSMPESLHPQNGMNQTGVSVFREFACLPALSTMVSLSLLSFGELWVPT